MSSTAGRAASVLRDGVVYSGSAIVNGVNAITPHFAGAVDILVVRQPDGTLKSTPFYVRFGKYSSLRAKDRTVRIFVNGRSRESTPVDKGVFIGSDTSLEMHLGSYGQAYFINETTEVYTASENEVEVDFSGMLSSPSGYSSNEDEEDTPYANAQMLETVRMEVCKIHEQESIRDRAGGSGKGTVGWQRREVVLPPSPFSKPAEDESVMRRPMDRARSEGEESCCIADIPSQTGPSEKALTRGSAHKGSSLLLSVKSCPSFNTLAEAHDERGDDGEPLAEALSGSLAEEVPPEVEFFSTGASPESSFNHNNSVIAEADLEPHLPSIAKTEDMGEVESSVFLDVNDGYDGDTEGVKRQDSSTSMLPSGTALAVGCLQDMELSLCGDVLKPEMSPVDAQRVFETHRVVREAFEVQGVQICQDPRLVCRLGGVLYPWSAAAPMVVGILAFGGNWNHLLQTTSSFSPASTSQVKTDSAEKASSGWRLWPFGGRTSKPTGEAVHPEQSPSVHSLHSKKKVRIVPKKVLSPTAEQLAALNLANGQNVISYRLSDSVQQEAYIYVMNWSSRLVISDIDGTVTRSDILGHLLPPIGVDWTHSGVAHLFSNIKANGYEIMFLSSRAIAQANITRDFLHRLEQEGVRMPVGPVIISPHGLLPSLYREMILRRPHDFKIGCLQDVRQLFPDHWNPFYAGFGNRETDVISYEESGVPPSRIFTINPRGLIIRGASSCVQTSTWSSLQSINELVNEVFPFYIEGVSPEIQREEYNEFQHWRTSASMMFFDDPELADLASFYSAQSSFNLSKDNTVTF